MDCHDIYADGRHYDLQNKDFVDDIPFYLGQIRRFGHPVLELGCGTGRVTIPLAQRGIQITGLDISRGMLSRAKEKAAAAGVDVEWIEADCRNFELVKRFKTILFPYNAIAHLHDFESIQSCFSCAKRHLSARGRFIVDIFNPCLAVLTRVQGKRYKVAEYPDPDGRGTVVITETNVYDAVSQINRITWYFKIGKRREEIQKALNMRIFYPQELDALLYYNGFVLEEKIGNYDGAPFTAASPKQLCVCRVRR